VVWTTVETTVMHTVTSCDSGFLNTLDPDSRIVDAVLFDSPTTYSIVVNGSNPLFDTGLHYYLCTKHPTVMHGILALNVSCSTVTTTTTTTTTPAPSSSVSLLSHALLSFIL